MNDKGGNIVIKNSKFTDFNTCGSIIRNKNYFWDRTAGTTPPTTYPEYYNYLANQLLFNEYSRTFSTRTAIFTCTPPNCFSINIDNTDFNNFNLMKSPLAVPVGVDPAKKMQYTGQILDLDGF